MKKLVELLMTIIIVNLISATLVASNSKMATTNPSVSIKYPVKVAVVVPDLEELFVSEIITNLKDIQKENEGKVQYTFFSSNREQAIENEIINTILENKEADILLVDLVDQINSAQEVINKIKEYNIPVIIFHREPYEQKDAIKSYGKALFIGSYSAEGGVLQGELIVDQWNKNKQIIDKNGDNIMQYIMLKGKSTDLDEIERTKNSIPVINNAGIKTEELASRFANWDLAQAKEITESLLLKYGNKIEVIIANNDAMAIGAIEVLQANGYNKGDKDKTITVTGVDGIPKAIELIKEGVMAGTIIQDAKGQAEALYIVGMNLAEHKNPIEGTKYKFDDTGVSIRIPYKQYTPS